MSAFSTLPPDQRAVLQLILKQGRGYAELSGLLRIDEAAVRARAHAGLDALAPGGEALSADRRAQIADWLLGQQSDAERAVTLLHLEDSPAARRWAGELHAHLEPVAEDALPALPAARPLRVKRQPLPPRPASADAAPPTRASSKLGGILLIGGLAALIAVLAVLLLGNDDDNAPSASTNAPTQAQTTRTTARADADDPVVLQQVNLNPPDGAARPLGVAFVMLRDDRPVIAVQVQHIAPNGEDDVYAAWLRASSTGSARFLGYVPGLVGRGGEFTVSAPLPDETLRFDQVVVSRESSSATRTPGRPSEILLQGALRVNRSG